MASYHRVCCCNPDPVCPSVPELPGVILTVTGAVTTLGAVDCPHFEGGFLVRTGRSAPLFIPQQGTSYSLFFTDVGSQSCLYTRTVSGQVYGQVITGSCGSCILPSNFTCGYDFFVSITSNQSYPSGWGVIAGICIPHHYMCCGGSGGTCTVVAGNSAATARWGVLMADPPFDLDDFLSGQVYSSGVIQIQRLP